ncbi:NAD(P)-binding protein [Hyaloscypha variabilis]
MAQTIGIAGFTGKFARCVVKSILQYPGVSVRGFCRGPSKLPPSVTTSSRIHIVKGEFNDKDAQQSFVTGTDVVICCYLGNEELMSEGQKLLIDACVANNVPRYIAGDFSVDITNIPYGALPPKDPCKDIMKYLESRDIQGVHILIGVFMETFWSDFMQIWDPRQNQLSYWGTGHEIWESTTYGTTAEYTAAVAMDTKAVGIQQFLGDRKSLIEIAEIFAKVYGFKPDLHNLGSLEDLHQSMHKSLQMNPADVMAWMPKVFFYWSQKEEARLKRDLDNSKYSHVVPVTFEDFFRRQNFDELAFAADNLTLEG